MKLLRALVASGLLASLPGSPPLSGAQPAAAPRLLVIVVVDQMRYDYLERMRPRWTGGMKRLLTEGAVFEQNFYPYLNTVTCAGHATIGTGSFPSTHGIIMNAWWRGAGNASCTDDATVRSIAYEPNGEAVGHSAAQLLVPTHGGSPARAVAGVARGHAVDEAQERDHAGRPPGRGVVAGRSRCVGHVDGVCREPGSRGAGIHHRESSRTAAVGRVDQTARTRRLHRQGRCARRRTATRLDGDVPAPAGRDAGHAAVGVPVPLGTEPVRGRVPHLHGLVAPHRDEARSRRRGRLSRHQLRRPGLRRSRVRPRQPRDPGHADEARSDHRRPAHGARHPRRARPLRAGAERRSRRRAHPGGPAAGAGAGRTRGHAADAGSGERRARGNARAWTARGSRGVHADLSLRSGAAKVSQDPRLLQPAIAALEQIPGVERVLRGAGLERERASRIASCGRPRSATFPDEADRSSSCHSRIT